MKTFGFAGLAMAAMLLSGCSTFVGGDLVREGQPVGAIALRNISGGVINVVTISRCSAMSHGLNALNGGEVIQNGGVRTWRVNAGCWDVGAGRSGVCAGGSCRWNEGYIRVQVPAGGQTVATFTAAPPN